MEGVLLPPAAIMWYDGLGYLKEFMRLRDTHSMFDKVGAKGGIGMSCAQLENGERMLEWEGVGKIRAE